jgi:hypothetical protein
MSASTLACSACSGRGFVIRGESAASPCQCAARKREAQYWAACGFQVSNPGLPQREMEALLRRFVILEGEVFRTKMRNVFATGAWPAVGWGMACALLADRPRARLTTDAWMRSTYYPDSGDKKSHVTFLEQVGSPDLLIIRLGFYFQKAGLDCILHEALRERERLLKPTWISTEPHLPWGERLSCWGRDLDVYLRSGGGYEFFAAPTKKEIP